MDKSSRSCNSGADLLNASFWSRAAGVDEDEEECFGLLWRSLAVFAGSRDEVRSGPVLTCEEGLGENIEGEKRGKIEEL